jgi:putative two-component system response regulator
VTQSARILVGDDDEASARFLKRLLTHEGHHVQIVASGDSLLAACALEPPDLVVLDLIAPRGAGFTVCRKLKEEPATRFVPVVVVTSQSALRDRLMAIQSGADDFLTKPFEVAELRARVCSLLRLKQYTDELDSAEEVILGLGATIEARDPCTLGHCQRLAEYATSIGRVLGLEPPDLQALERGGYLHDLGKIAVPDHVLLKTGALDEHESRVMRDHPLVGDTLCAGMRSLASVRPIVRHHHERLDGSGYPDGLRSAQVPILAQIVSIADVFDALTTDRPYHHAISRDEAVTVLADEVKKGWRDRALVDAFVGVL